MNNKELELEANKLYPVILEDDWDKNKQYREEWIAGATSKYVKRQKLKFAIKQLIKLDSILQDKYRDLSDMQKIHSGKMKESYFTNKKSGLKLAKEEIRRDIKELEQELKEYETE